MGEYSGVLLKPANIAGKAYNVGDEVERLTEKQYKYLIATQSLGKKEVKPTAPAVEAKK